MKHICVLTTGLWFALAAIAQPERPADNATAARIADGFEKVQAGKLLDAIEQFQRVLDTAGDELVPADHSQFTPARWVVHGYLARLPAEGVKLYRQRVDGQAVKRLAEAKKSRDDARLHRLLADMFVARATEEAILELARRAFERADFDAAEHYWRMLLPRMPDDERILIFPDPKTPLAAIQARLILVKLFRGERNEAKNELKALRDKWPNEAGLLAGKTGKYVDTLTELVNDPAQTTLPRLPDAPDWPTFAGSPTRIGTNRAKLPYFWPDVATWKTPLPFGGAGRFDTAPPDPLHPRALAFYPIVTDGRGYLAGGNRILSINLMTGQLASADSIKDAEEVQMPSRHDIRYTLTADEGLLFARLGPTAMKQVEGAHSRSLIVALSPRKWNTEAREVVWHLDPPAAEGAFTLFEGTPIVQSGRIYAAFWRQAGADATAGIACYRIDDPKAVPELVWQRIVGKAGGEPNNQPRYRQSLVTMSGPNVVYCTDGGTVIALDAITGKPAWEYRYPRNERAIMPRYRDLCPPLADGGRIYAAPADTDRLLCIDAYSGRLIWEREGVEVIHLLGVARGRLIATFGGPVRGIRGLNLRTGADSGPNGWTIHDDGGESTFGRGLVTEDAVVWPTRHGLQFIDPADGSPLRSPIPGTFGNLCYADGVLLVTTAMEVWGFVTEAKKLGDRRKAVEADPDNPAKHADLTQSLIDAGQYADAETEAAKAGEAKDRLRWLLAERAMRAGERETALAIYRLLAGGKSNYATAGASRLAETIVDKVEAHDVWLEVGRKRGIVRDQRGMPWNGWAFAEIQSGTMWMRPWILDTHFDGPSPRSAMAQSQGFVRESQTNWDDSTLQIVHCSSRGIIGQGNGTYFRGTVSPVTSEQPILASFPVEAEDSAWLVFCGRQWITSWFWGQGKLAIDAVDTRSIPRFAPLERVLLPVASNSADGGEFSSLFMGSGGGFGGESYSYVGVFDQSQVFSLAPGLRKNWVYPETGAFPRRLHPVVSAGGGYVLAQTAGGRMLVLIGGHLLHEIPVTTKPWPASPVAVKSDTESQTANFLIPDDGSVLLFDAKAGKELARYTIPDPESLTGELPRFRMHQGDPLLLIDRNHGVEVDRLRVANLQRAWSQEAVFVGRHLDDIAFARTRFFTVADGMLVARSWKDGKQLWETPLPEAPNTTWKLAVSPQGLLAYPAEALLRHPSFDAVGEFRRAGLDKAALLRAVSRTYDVWTDRELPVLVIDPEDGRLVQRLTFSAAGPAAGVAVTLKGVVVVTGRGSWTLTAR